MTPATPQPALAPPAVGTRRRWFNNRSEWIALAALLVLPAALHKLDSFGGAFSWLSRALGGGDTLTDLFIFGILALGLNVVVGYAGLFHLGIGAFFGIGAYVTAVLTVRQFPFHLDFTEALTLAVVATTLCGIVLGAPTLRLRGDYLALVTLGFGEVVQVSLKNLEHITGGVRTLAGLKQPDFPAWLDWMNGSAGSRFFGSDMRFYYLALTMLVGAIVVLKNIECSRLGRAWVTLREDELASSCMGINSMRAKLSAFALSAALAGLGGGLYATRLTNTADPSTQYGFPLSITALSFLILGGLGSIRGALLGVLLLKGFELILMPQLHVSNWDFLIYGLVLIVMLRFRPEGLLPSRRVQHEFHAGGSRPAPPAAPPQAPSQPAGQTA